LLVPLVLKLLSKSKYLIILFYRSLKKKIKTFFLSPHPQVSGSATQETLPAGATNPSLRLSEILTMMNQIHISPWSVLTAPRELSRGPGAVPAGGQALQRLLVRPPTTSAPAANFEPPPGGKRDSGRGAPDRRPPRPHVHEDTHAHGDTHGHTYTHGHTPPRARPRHSTDSPTPSTARPEEFCISSSSKPISGHRGRPLRSGPRPRRSTAPFSRARLMRPHSSPHRMAIEALRRRSRSLRGPSRVPRRRGIC
jgi:hypothetical protein